MLNLALNKMALFQGFSVYFLSRTERKLIADF